jgi:hypothetical protein
MSHEITTTPAAPAEQLQWIYTLEWYDHLAWWQHEAELKPAPAPTRRDNLLLWILWMPLLTGMVFGGCTAAVGAFKARDPALFALCLIAIGVSLLLIWGVFHVRPMRILRRELTKDNTDAGLQMRAKLLEAEGDVINPNRTHWLLLDDEEFTVASELQRVSPRGVVRYEYREVSCRWELLDQVILADGHVFLVRTGDDAWIVPRRAFIDAAAVDQFVTQVRAFQEAARARAKLPAPEGICLSPAAQSSPSPITGNPP